MLSHRTSTVAVLAASLLALAAPVAGAAGQSAEAQVLMRDKSGDQAIAGKAPAWVKASARSQESDIRRVKVEALADSSLRATFTLGALRATRVQQGAELYRGTYTRSWEITLVLVDDDAVLPFRFGYEESKNGRLNPDDKPRVYTEGDFGYRACATGAVKFRPQKRQVRITLPAACAPTDELRGAVAKTSAHASTQLFGTDDRWFQYGSDTVSGPDLEVPKS
ncbi:hypothetical protein [Nocardioides sp. 616]|uniref:hypothetical protein n=1 Tax=Nocardioides sp. 616 TaxID=2268090 RepID=UPI000CE57722|nr:hypothetical protein [Nocardioides sp. 616]